MKLSQRPDTPPAQFEGHTPQEAVRKAREAFGSDARVRCWKTRSGGVLGFFAREGYVAGITPPVGAIKAVKTPRNTRDAKEREEPKQPRDPKEPMEPNAAQVAVSEQAHVAPVAADQLSLSSLVEETSDEVTLGSEWVPDAVFSEVLAQAQAAVNGTDVVTPPPSPVLPAPPLPGDSQPIESSQRIEASRQIEVSQQSPVTSGVLIADRPGAVAATLDGLARAVAELPAAPAAPVAGGSVIVVVGARRDAEVAARALVATLGLKSSVLLTVDRTTAGRQRVERRRFANKVTVVVVKGSLRSDSLPAVARWIKKVRPDYVLGAVPATVKRSDVERWRMQLGRVDALALARLGETSSPGELIGLLPIAYLDGDEASALRWILTLLRARLSCQP